MKCLHENCGREYEGKHPPSIWNYDISSAYPYQLYFLPCLVHGKWSKTKSRKRMTEASNALVHYHLKSSRTFSAWGPFPFREEDGSISFPGQSGGGWVYQAEYLAGERVFPSQVKFSEAWIYHLECDCVPFRLIPYYYLQRIKIGKEGPGIVIKLAVNSCYGKLAQSIGNATFNCWIWAGMITSGTRAQILDMMGLHKDLSNLLMIATDGIYTRERLGPMAGTLHAHDIPPAMIPKKTGTFTLLDGKPNPKPLGGWEEKEVPRGVFMARPGIYFPLNPTENELKEIRGRGVGKGVVLQNHQRILESYETHGMTKTVTVANVSRFCGAKTSISVDSHGRYTRASGENGPNSPSYGQWVSREVALGFDPLPKRERVRADGVTLQLRRFPLTQTSQPYSRVKSREGKELEAAYAELLEQPDADLADFED